MAKRKKPLIALALGGNALLPEKEKGTLVYAKSPVCGKNLKIQFKRIRINTQVPFSEYSKYGVGISLNIDYNRQRAENQSASEQLGRSLIQAAGVITGEAISGFGSIPQILENIYKEATNQEVEFENGDEFYRTHKTKNKTNIPAWLNVFNPSSIISQTSMSI